jgi:hypothetical protein
LKDSRNDQGIDYFLQIGLQFDKINYPGIPENARQKEWIRICTPGIICRKNAIQHVGGFDERMRIAEDIRLWFRLAQEGRFAVVSEPLAIIRGWKTSMEQLTNPTFSFFKESANVRLEVFMESYARAVSSPPDVQKRLRTFIADGLAEQAKYSALDGKYAIARRRAFESLAFSPGGKTALKALVGLIFPMLFHLLAKKYIKP